MESAIEDQLIKILNKISLAERTRNRKLERQTSKLFRALFFMKATSSRTKTATKNKE